MDKQGIEHIISHSFEDFTKYLDTTENTICGRHPIQLMLAIIEEAKKVEQDKEIVTKMTHYAQSSQVTDPDDSSVSYASTVTTISVWKSENGGEDICKHTQKHRRKWQKHMYNLEYLNFTLERN